MRFAIFPLHLSKVLRLPRKSDARSYEVLHLSRKIIAVNLQIWCSKMQPISGKSAPGPPNSSDEDVSCTAPAAENASLQILFKCPMPAIVFGHATKPSHFAHFWQGAQSLAPATRNELWTSKSGANMWCFVHFHFGMCFAPQRRTLFDIATSKSVRTWCVLYILTSKCASRHNGVHFFDISTSKSGPKLVCFAHFDLEMCFAPQRRAIFHLSSGQVAPLALASLLSTLRSHKSLEKHSVSRLAYLFAHLQLLSSDSFSSLWLFPSLLFICPYCRKFDF